MAYCPDCGVELAPEASSCPLCGRPVDRKAGHGAHFNVVELLDPEDHDRLSSAEQRRVGWEVRSVSAFIAAAAVSAINLVESGGLSWSLYPLASILYLWVLSSAVVGLGKRPVWAGLVVALATPAFLLALDAVDGTLGWSLHIALPIAAVTELAAGAVGLAAWKAARKGINLIAFGLFGVVAVCVGIEISLGFALWGRLAFRWSAIVAFSLIPVAAFLLYLQYRLGKGTSLRRIFRL
jgi:hypothetical protein